jgi:hypothetical protein
MPQGFTVPLGAHISTTILFVRSATLCLLVLVTVLLWLRAASAAPVSVRFVEGVTHGFIVLRTVNGGLVAAGDLLQVQRRGEVESRIVFRFKDGSVYNETVVFTQDRVFTLQSYHLVHRGPAFTEDTEISLERASGKYRVKTKAHKDGREQVLNGALDLPLAAGEVSACGAGTTPDPYALAYAWVNSAPNKNINDE